MNRHTQTSLIILPLSSLVLALVDIVSVILAFGLYTALRPKDQVLFQAPVAAFLVCLGCALLQETSSALRPAWTPRWTIGSWIGIQAGALVFSAAIFVPLHLATQGYLTSFSNVSALWLFQIPTNALALALAALLARRRPVHGTS